MRFCVSVAKSANRRAWSSANVKSSMVSHSVGGVVMGVNIFARSMGLCGIRGSDWCGVSYHYHACLYFTCVVA